VFGGQLGAERLGRHEVQRGERCKRVRGDNRSRWFATAAIERGSERTEANAWVWVIEERCGDFDAFRPVLRARAAMSSGDLVPHVEVTRTSIKGQSDTRRPGCKFASRIRGSI
jgi:hypothetical protein